MTTDTSENASLIERLRGPLPSVYVPFGDDGDLAWDGVLSRERQLRERLEAADEIERLRAEVERLSNDGCTCGYGGFHEPLNERCRLNGGVA